jgi:hypothetical protein
MAERNEPNGKLYRWDGLCDGSVAARSAKAAGRERVENAQLGEECRKALEVETSR